MRPPYMGGASGMYPRGQNSYGNPMMAAGPYAAMGLPFGYNPQMPAFDAYGFPLTNRPPPMMPPFAGMDPSMMSKFSFMTLA